MMQAVEWLVAGWTVLSVLGIGVILLATWRAEREAVPPGAAEPAPDGTAATASARPAPLTASALDVAREFAAALAAVQELATENLIELQMTVQPRLAVWTNPAALQRCLTTGLTQAIQRAASAVLLCANWHGGRVHVTVLDDGAVGNPAVLTASLREVEQVVALQGGTLEIACIPGRGNVLTLRLPGLGEPEPETPEDEMPALVPDAAHEGLAFTG